MIIPEDVTEYLTSENLTEMANDLSKALSKNACFSLYIDKTCVRDVFSDSPLNTDTWIIRTIWHVPLVSVLTGFHCI